MVFKKLTEEVEADEVSPSLDVEAALPDESLCLKVDHTHSNKVYPAGTPLSEFDASVSESSLDFMKKNNIV